MNTYKFQDSIQQGIIYLCKADKDFIIQVLPMMKAEYFDSSMHGTIFSIIKDYYISYKTLPSDDTVIEECKKFAKTEDKLKTYLTEIENINNVDISSLNNREYILGKVEAFAQHQSIAGALIESVGFLEEGKIDQIPLALRKAMNVGRTVDIGQNYLDSIDSRHARAVNGGDRVFFQTPFEHFNALLSGGLSPKEMAMVVAPPGVGKSLYLANQAAVSICQGKNVLYISLEMSEDKISFRLDSILSRVSQDEMRVNPGKVKERLTMLKKKLPNMGKLMIKEFPTKRCSVNGIRAYLNQLKNFCDFEPDVLIIDYLELLGGDSSLPEYKAQEVIAQELRGLAVEEELLVWTATQTNRQGKTVDVITDTEFADSY